MVIGGTAVFVAAGITGIYLFNNKGGGSGAALPSSASTTLQTSDTTTSLTDTSVATDTTTTTATSASSSSYKDGQYSANTTYYVPHGTNTLSATVTIANGSVTAVKVSHDYSDNESGMYIDSFENAIQSAVVGKPISGLSLSRIGGASLTTQAFDDVLATIESNAKA